MEYENSSLQREVQAVIAAGTNPVHFSYTMKIHVNTTSMDFTPFKIIEIDFDCNYEGNYGDEILATVQIPAGVYLKQIYPYKDNIDITLTKTPLLEGSDAIDTTQPVQTEVYTGTLIDTGNPAIESNSFNAIDQLTLDLSSLLKVTFQLVDKALEQMRLISVGGKYRYTTGGDVAKALLTQYSRTVKVPNSRLPQGVNMEPISNTEIRDHVVLPDGLKLTDIPQYIHLRCGGIYSAGLGYYYQGDYWYLYPCFDVTRFNAVEQSVTILNVPKNKLRGVERTYRQDGSNLVIVCTGEVRFKDDTEVQQLNLGNGVRFTDANNVMEGFVTVSDNKAIASRGKNNSEFVATPRANGINNVQFSTNAITANPYYEYGKMARRLGCIISMVWENSDPQLIIPGMMVRIHYLQNDKIGTIDGVVLRKHTFVHMKGMGMLDTKYLTNTSLSIFVQKPKADT